MKILTGSICNIGGREYNQDYVKSTVQGGSACLVVCDGLGSYIGSEVASRLCATQIVESFEQVQAYDSKRAVKREYCDKYIENAHNYVINYKERNPKISSSCTTVACVVTDGTNTSFAHIGDTRVYFFRQNKLAYQSKDHSLSQVAVEMGQIKLHDIRTHKDQNKLTRVLGSDYFSPADIEALQEPLLPGDSFVLCTDGFWEYVYEDEMEIDLATSKTPDEAIAKMQQRLLARVTKYNDNYSAIVAMVVN